MVGWRWRLSMITDRVIFSIFPNENFIDLGMYQAGMERCEPGHIFGPVARNNYLFHYVLEGEGTLMANNSREITQTYSIRKGQGFMLFPGQIATYYTSQERPWTYMWIEFGGLRVHEALLTTELSVNQSVYRASSFELRKAMKEELLYIIHNSQEPPLCLIGHLYLFFDALIRSCALPKASSTRKMSDYYVKEAVHYIEQNYADHISVEMIAEILGIDRSYFSKIFRQSTGVSPQRFIIEYRMTKAASLLKLTRLTIQEIGRQVGYDNPFHFTRAFKEVFKVPPRQWRKDNAPVSYEGTDNKN